MELEALLVRLTYLRRAWLAVAVATGVLHALLVLFFLYSAWVQYVVVKTGAAAFTGVHGGLARFMAHWVGLMDASLLVFRIVALALWLAWLFLASRFAHRLSPEAPPLYAPWLMVAGWFLPVLLYVLPTLMLLDLARVTLGQGGLAADRIADRDEPDPMGRDLPLLSLAIGVFTIVSSTFLQVVARAVVEDFQDPVRGQQLLHLAAAGGVASLLMLLAVDAYIRRLAYAQQTRLARRYVAGG